jgi:DNA-binding transcriptional LysR family regulator
MVDWGGAFAQSFAESFPDLALPRIRLGSGSLALDLLLASGGTAYLAEPMVRSQLLDGRLHQVEGAPEIWRRAFAVYRSGEGRRGLLVEEMLEKLSAAPRKG